jgi:hypothetical protein
MMKFSPQRPKEHRMVTRNQHDGANSNGWWDDLPPAVKKRVQPPGSQATDSHTANDSDEPVPYRPAVVYDLTRLAVLFLGVALVNLLFLLVALSFLSGH